MPSTELNRKQFSFDIIPSNMVDNITVSKSITPDKSAEFGGGLVEVNTKNIPTENFVSATIGSTVNSMTSGKEMLALHRSNTAWLGNYDKSRYLFGQKNWNSLADIRAYQAAHGTQPIMSNNWEPFYYKAQPSSNFQLSLGRVMELDSAMHNKLGVIASLSYRNTQSIQTLFTTRNTFDGGFTGNQYGYSTNIGALLGAGYTTARHKIIWQNIFTRLLDERLNYGIGSHADYGPGIRGLFDQAFQTNLWQSQLKGEHAIGGKGIKVNWMGSYAYVERLRPDNHAFLWKSPPADQEGASEFNVIEGFAGSSSVGPPSNPAPLCMFSDAQERNLSWDANIMVPFKLSITKNTFKAGYAGWYKDRKFYVALLGQYPGSTTTAPALGQLFGVDNGGGRSVVSEFGDDYKRKAPLHALYGMFDTRIADKLRLVWGLRAEYLDMDKINQAVDELQGSIIYNGGAYTDYSALRDLTKKWQFFPSANLTYTILPNFNFRASYAKSIIRPDLRELAYFREYDFELGGIYQADLLTPTTIKNYDARLEWYPGAGEIISVSYFYKNMKNPMEIYKNQNTYNLKNNYAARNKGIELEARKSLAFTGVPVIKNLTLYGNFTYTQSWVTPMDVKISDDASNPKKLAYLFIVQPEVKRPLSGLSNYLTNAGMYYDDKHLHISLSYNSVSNRLVVANDNVVSWQFEKPMQAFDGQIAYRFMKQKAEVKLNLSNLLNQSNIIYVNEGTEEEKLNSQKNIYTQKYLLYDKNKDRLIQKLTPGRTYGLSLSYNF